MLFAAVIARHTYIQTSQKTVRFSTVGEASTDISAIIYEHLFHTYEAARNISRKEMGEIFELCYIEREIEFLFQSIRVAIFVSYNLSVSLQFRFYDVGTKSSLLELMDVYTFSRRREIILEQKSRYKLVLKRTQLHHDEHNPEYAHYRMQDLMCVWRFLEEQINELPKTLNFDSFFFSVFLK